MLTTYLFLFLFTRCFLPHELVILYWMNSFQMSFQISWILSSDLDTTQSDISISGFSNHLADAFLFGNVVHKVFPHETCPRAPRFYAGSGRRYRATWLGT